MTKPAVFIGSSKEGLDVADAIRVHLSDTALVTVWDDGGFGLGAGTLDELVRMSGTYDFAVLVLTPDDVVMRAGERQDAPRDNVMFELGLFLGSLGRDRTFAVCSNSPLLRLPSDMAGITIALFDHEDAERDLMAAVGPACVKLSRAIRQVGRVDRTVVDSRRQLVVEPKTILDGVTLVSVGCTPDHPNLGSDIELEYVLDSSVEAIRVWFGANLHRDGKYFYDVNEDSEAVLTAGRNRHRRRLPIPSDIEPGEYALQVEVWFGERSNPTRSIALATRWPDRMLTLR